MQQQLLTMLTLQDSMNTKVHEQWRQQGFAWYRAIWVEAAEMLDHYGWKWWKHQQPDIEQVQLELVDIFHFGLSALLLASEDQQAIVSELEAQLQAPVKADSFAETLELMVANTLATKGFDVPTFAGLMQWVDMSFDDLFKHYVGKNVLNFFRQDHGYKTGEYQKIWNGQEDNEVLMAVLNRIDPEVTDFQQQVYDQLKAAYSQVK